MDDKSTLISIDNDEKYLSIAQEFLDEDERLRLVLTEWEDSVRNNLAQKYGYIIAGTWLSKYFLLDEVLEILEIVRLYILDDMLPQTNWTEGHQEKVVKLVKYIGIRDHLFLTNQNWSTRKIIAVKK